MALSLSCAAIVHAVMPFSTARVTRVENKVSYGQVSGGRSNTRPASAQDVVKASDFLLTESDSRAELQYQDGSLVRVGQNTIFSFDANTRTLHLEKGTFVFFIPKGMGGATIKTPSLTAAITGTVGKVSEYTIAIIEGEIKLVPSGQIVHAGQFARYDPVTKEITIGDFDPGKTFDGKLMTFNGAIPGLPETGANTPTFSFTPPPGDDSQSRATNVPSVINKENTQTFVPPPKQTGKPGTKTPY